MGNFAIGMVLKGITVTPVFTASTTPFQNSQELVNTLGQVIAPNITYSSNDVTWFNDIRDPNGVTLTEPPMAGVDVGLYPTFRGYTSMTWTYNLIRSDEWYYLYYIWRFSRQTAGGNGGHIWIQWPDPQSGQIQTVNGRWDIITSAQRDVGAFSNVTLQFNRLGIDTPHQGALTPQTIGIFYAQ